jgi:homocysteine S-methyltransferase
MGARNLVVITGDPPKMGDYPKATAVFDLDSVELLKMINWLNQGIDPSGRGFGEQTQFLCACGAEPGALDYDREIDRLGAKVRAGAEYVMTQPVYDPAVLERFLEDVEQLEVPVLVGLLPLASHRNAEFLHNEVPGMQVPEHIRERMKAAGSGDAAQAEGVAIAQEMLEAVKHRVAGAYVIPPFSRYQSAIDVLKVVGYGN